MKKIVKVSIFIIALFVSFRVVYHVLSLKDTNGSNGSAINQLKHLEKNTVDVAFVGSSHVYYGIMPATLWEEQGISAYDMSISSMDKTSLYYHLKYLLKTQSPKVVMVDVLSLTFDKQLVASNEYRNMLGLDYSIDTIKMVKEYADPESRLDFITKFPIIHTRYHELTRYDFYDSDYASYGKGERVDTKQGGNADFTVPWTCSEITPLSPQNEAWLDRLCSLAKEKDFELIFYVTPWSADEERQKIINAMDDYASEHNVKFYDLSLEARAIGLDSNADYIDPEHLNVHGAVKTTRWIGNEILSAYDLADHRGDAKYSSWNDDTIYSWAQIKLSQIKNMMETDQIAEALALIRDSAEFTYILSLDGDWKDSTLPLADYVSLFNVPPENIGNGGAWVGSYGNTKMVVSNEDSDTYFYKLDRYSTIKFDKTYASTYEGIVIGYDNYQLAANGLTILVYDHTTHNVITIGGLF